MPMMLSVMPPTALWSAMIRIRRLMCMNSSTFLRELSMTTTPAASAVSSLFCPIAMPTVAAIMAGASLMPSPTYKVWGAADDGEFIFTTLLGVDFGDAHLLGQGTSLRLAIPRHDP